MTFRIIFHPIAEANLDGVPARFRWCILNLIDGLSKDPYPPKSKQLRDPLNRYHRLPLENWRVWSIAGTRRLEDPLPVGDRYHR